MSLSKKHDFAVIFKVKNANPNGDPLNGNRPRTNYEGFGEVSDVCLKRKIRNRLMQSGESILIQSDDNKLDDWKKRLLETVASHIALALNMTEKASQSRLLALSEERSVIARELHDSLAQSLSYLKIQVSRLEKSIISETDKEQSLDISHGIRNGLNFSVKFSKRTEFFVKMNGFKKTKGMQ